MTLHSGENPLPGGDFVERDPVVTAYLAFLERDMSEHPERLRPFSEADIARIDALTRDVTVSDEDVIPDDVTV